MINQKYTIKELLEHDSFQKWVRGEASPNEKIYWDNWVMGSDENRRTARAAMQQMSGFTLDPRISPNTDNAWIRFSKRMNHEEKTISRVAIRGNNRQRIDLKWIYRIAAGILVITMAGLSVYFGYSEDDSGSQPINTVTEHRILTNFGERKTIKLEDGSLINLNANSEMVYRVSSENPEDITVNLEGEAFFNVSERTSSDQYAFKVTTDDGFVRVLGTEFSISTRDEKTQVVLEEGSVEVTSYQENQQKKRQLILKPNHMAEFNGANDTLVVRWVNTEVYTSWKTNELVFDNTPLPEVLKRIEYTFGVTVEINDPALKQRKLSGTMENTKMNVILSTLSQTLSTPVEIDGEKVTIGVKTE